MSLISDILDDLVEDLEDANEIVGSDPGPLQEPRLGQLEARLDSALSRISNVLEEIGDDGAATSEVPSTLPAIAASCVTLAQAAHHESLTSAPDHTLIGDKLKTIAHRITAPGGYRSKAGL